MIYTIGTWDVVKGKFDVHGRPNEAVLTKNKEYAFKNRKDAEAYIKSGEANDSFSDGREPFYSSSLYVFGLKGDWEKDTYQEKDKYHRSLLKHLEIIWVLEGYIGGNTVINIPERELFSMCKEGCLTYVEELVEQGLNPNARNGHALNEAVKEGHLEIVKYLVEKGADVNNYSKPVKVAIWKGYDKIVAYLLDKGAETPNLSSSWLTNFVTDEKTMELLHERGLVSEDLLEEWIDFREHPPCAIP
jgi:hypothetical protein